MSAFQLTVRVLEKMEPHIRQTRANDFDEQVMERLRYLSGRYRQLHSPFAKTVDYGDGATQFAYAYKYVTAHSDYLLRLLRATRNALKRPLFEGKSAKVACLGGGPGSDMLALLRYLKEAAEPVKSIEVDILDKEEGWWPWIQAYIEESKVPVHVTYGFEEIDVSDSATFESIDFSQYDLFTSSFFLSEIHALGLGAKARAFFRAVFDEMAPGSLFLLRDNGGDERIYGYFDKIVAGAGAFDALVSVDEIELRCADSYDPIRHLIERFKRDHPRKNGTVCGRALVKS